MIRVFVSLLFLLVIQSEPDVIHLTVTDGSQPLSEVMVQFDRADGSLAGACVTGTDGRCDLALGEMPGDGLIRGLLTVGAFGQRSLTWPGGAVEVEIDVQALALPHAPESTLPPPTLTLPAAVPPTVTLPSFTTCTPAPITDEMSDNLLHVCVIESGGRLIPSRVQVLSDSEALLGDCITKRDEGTCIIDLGAEFTGPLSGYLIAASDVHQLRYGGGYMEIVVDLTLGREEALVYSNLELPPAVPSAAPTAAATAMPTATPEPATAVVSPTPESLPPRPSTATPEVAPAASSPHPLLMVLVGFLLATAVYGGLFVTWRQGWWSDETA